MASLPSFICPSPGSSTASGSYKAAIPSTSPACSLTTNNRSNSWGSKVGLSGGAVMGSGLAEEGGGGFGGGDGKHVAGAFDELELQLRKLGPHGFAVEAGVEDVVAGAVENRDRHADRGVALNHGIEAGVGGDEIRGDIVEAARAQAKNAASANGKVSGDGIWVENLFQDRGAAQDAYRCGDGPGEQAADEFRIDVQWPEGFGDVRRNVGERRDEGQTTNGFRVVERHAK